MKKIVIIEQIETIPLKNVTEGDLIIGKSIGGFLYKLHHMTQDAYSWISLKNSDCLADGKHCSFISALSSPVIDEKFVLDNIFEITKLKEIK